MIDTVITSSAYERFADEKGLLHHVERPTTNSSENELLFTAEYLNLRGFKYDPRVYAMFTFYANEVTSGKRISHDNKTGMVSVFPDLNESIFKVGGRLWLHPRDIVFYGYQKYGWPFYPLLPIVSISNIISCARTWKTHDDGRSELTTSGKMLAWFRNRTAGLHLTQKICTWLIKRNPHFGSWYKIGKIYFSAEGHPIPELMKKELDK